MARPVVVEQSRAIPVSVEDAFAGTMPISLPQILSQWYGVIPPIKEVREQTGAWDAAGQTRVLLMVGGGRVSETLTSVEPPNSFAYKLSSISGPLSALVTSVDGRWSFAPAGTGTRVSWQWTLHPKSPAASAVMPVFARMWQGYARVALEKLSAQLVD
ncbi:SRPBCC family protein [Mycobacterium vicinigordonae]|uniref:SRPBCC family protein n=1 Tax=Mycobacterium vicinigordonae TaxID=1719132 RepID=A0A7D6HTR0_9MYCO|nr:SRPBCC family protein [Mycobacterium vicinigordonae]QLL06473.1 SRPBCC family protein [Mycobacterium vicinigordonae]